jgi:S-(hydroxymethyl)glutathione dehydrogenase/alcohol dehydrogenase
VTEEVGAAVRTRAAVLWPGASEWSVEEIALDPPGPGEVLVRLAASGMCHSDDRLRRGGYAGMRLPMIGGHEGAGVVESVGPGVRRLRPGDSVVLSIPVPPCGDCPACLAGLTYFCERGALLGEGFQVSDGTARHHARGQDLGAFVFLGAFAEHTVVDERSCVAVDASLPPELACTIGCAGVTGWGAVLNTGAVRPGEVVVVAGVGGIGANSVQAARFAGARAVVAVDREPFKREVATKLGATVAVASLEEALPAVRELTAGRLADVVVMALGDGDGRLLEPALSLVGRRGRVVVAAAESTATIDIRALQSQEKQLLGCFAGSWDGRRGIAFLAGLHRAGHYDLDTIVTRTYGSLDDLATGYRDLAEGRVIRGVITHHH